MPYRLAIFDFDGTLADSFPVFLGTLNAAADRFAFRRLTPADADALRGSSAWEVMRHLGIPMWKVPAITAFARRHMAAAADAVSLFSGAAELLEALAAGGVRIAIVSSNAEATVRRILGPRHAALVAHYGCGASIFGKRPKLRQTLAELRVAPAEALSVGDEVRDLVASRAEGIAFGAVAWGFTRPDALAARRPDALFERMEEIGACLVPRAA